MPRFDNEGFNPNRRIDNDQRDRSVPESENYYGNVPIDLNFNSRGKEPEIRDNQSGQPYYPNTEYTAPQRTRERQASHKKKKKRKALKKRNTALIIILIIILIPSLLIGGVLGRINYDEHKENQYVSANELKSSPFVKNILLLGVDARPTQEAETSRADTMMLISVDLKHRCIKLTSFLRDTWVYIPAKDGEQRLNATSTYDGYSGVVDTIEYNFGVDIDGYVVADFEMFKVLVDSVGGVEVDVTAKEAKEVTKHKKRYGNVTLEKGTHNLTGEQALAYCRIRKIDTDFKRTERQRTVMKSILSKAKSNPFRLYKMASKSAPYIETDLSKGQLIRIASLAGICLGGDMPQTQIPFDKTWQYANKGGASVIAINKEKNKEILIDNIYNKSAKELMAEE